MATYAPRFSDIQPSLDYMDYVASLDAFQGQNILDQFLLAIWQKTGINLLVPPRTEVIFSPFQGQLKDRFGCPLLYQIGAWQEITKVELNTCNGWYEVPVGGYRFNRSSVGNNPITEIYLTCGRFPAGAELRITGKDGFFPETGKLPDIIKMLLPRAFESYKTYSSYAGMPITKTSDLGSSTEVNTDFAGFKTPFAFLDELGVQSLLASYNVKKIYPS